MDLIEVPPGEIKRHPWEIARAACILGLIGSGDFETVADFGAGDLYFARELSRRYPARTLAVDRGYERATELEGIRLRNSLSDVGDGSLDLAFLMDVLEHEQDDRRFLEDAFRKVKPGGRLVVTVPAYPCLFSAHDRSLGHLRRYRRCQFYTLLRDLEVEQAQSFHFFTLPLLLRCLQLLLPKRGRRPSAEGIAAWRLGGDHFITRWLIALLKADFGHGRRLAEVGIPWPGLSICLIIRKRSAS
jgi:SAM-dependent methyltransferase